MVTERIEAKFVVDLSSARISPEVASVLQSALQRTALEVVAQLDIAGEMTVRIPDRDWLGIWIEGDLGGFRQLGDLKGLGGLR